MDAMDTAENLGKLHDECQPKSLQRSPNFQHKTVYEEQIYAHTLPASIDPSAFTQIS
jgi:hypothetical protein